MLASGAMAMFYSIFTLNQVHWGLFFLLSSAVLVVTDSRRCPARQSMKCTDEQSHKYIDNSPGEGAEFH